MEESERRKHPRIETSNTVSYVCVDVDGNEVSEGFGSALDLSLGGVKLTSREPLETPYVLLLVIDLEEEVLEVKGRVIYSRKKDGGGYLAGIQFIDTEEKHHKAIRNFVKMYHGTRREAGQGRRPC